MAKMTVVDDNGDTFEFTKFVAVGVMENGQIMRMIEDEGQTPANLLSVMMELGKLISEIAQLIQPDEGG